MAIEVRGEDACGGNLLDSLHQSRCGISFAEVLKHQCRGPDRAYRIGDSFAGDVEGGSVDGLEHGREPARGIEVGRRRNAETTGESASKVRKDVGVKIGGDNGVDRSRFGDHSSRHGIDEHFLPFYFGKVAGHFGGDSSHKTMPWRCALDLVTTVSSLRGRCRASSKAYLKMRVTQRRVKTETSVATSSGKPIWERPPWPEYSP